MIEVYFHTMQMLQRILNPGERVFYSHGEEEGYSSADLDKWLLSPGITDNGLGSAIDIPEGLLPNSMGIGVVDGAAEEKLFSGPSWPAIVTISILVPIASPNLWFKAKDTSTKIRQITQINNPVNDFSTCNITPDDYGVTDLITPGTSVVACRSIGREVVIPDIGSQGQNLWVFYRTFNLEMCF